MEALGAFDVSPFEGDPDNHRGFRKVDAGAGWAKQVSGLFSQMPEVVGTSMAANAYIVKFPQGVSGSLMQLKSGGLDTTIVDSSHQFVGHAALYPLSGQAVVMGVFTAMSIVTNQYFLAQINSEMRALNQGIDRILEFLYGDKKAELMSALMFVKNAYQNYQFIAACDSQKAAIIGNLQNARMIAMKDIEFYIGDLERTSSRGQGNDVVSSVNQAIAIKGSMDLAMQLYVMSNLLEIFYSENFDKAYLANIEKEMEIYIDKFEKRILADFSKLEKLVSDLNQNFVEQAFNKVDKKSLWRRISEVTGSLNNGNDTEYRKVVHDTLESVSKPSEYCICKNGDVYLKV